jgi:hypothetical protein
MESLIELNRWLHVAIGFTGLCAFWIPVAARKGGPLHRAAGRVFRVTAYLVSASAACAVSLRMLHHLQRGVGPGEAPSSWAALVFLAYLALITFVMVSHGIAVLDHKRDPRTLATPYRRLLAWASIGGSLFIIAWAAFWRPDNAVVLYALSPIGVLNGVGMLQLYRRPPNTPRAWLGEHLGAMLGAGIAFHTAFAVFGMNRLLALELPGLFAVVPWLLPTAVGLPAIRWWRWRVGRNAIDPAT